VTPDLDDSLSMPDAARIAVEFEWHLRSPESEEFLHGDPPSRVYWIVKLGRLALRRDGTWDYLGSTRHWDFEAIRAQRFVNFEEAVRAATSVFGVEPEHAGYMRKHAVELENNDG